MKSNPKADLKKIRNEVKKSLAGSSEEAIRKATEAAVAKFHSKRKKEKRDNLKTKAQKILQNTIAEKWCPRNEAWFDDECENSYNLLYLLGAMLDINIEKSTDQLEELYRVECSKHFDLLAKKRFNAPEAPATTTAPDSSKTTTDGDDTENKEVPAKTYKKKKTKL